MSTGVPSASVATTRPAMEGPVRRLAPAPLVAAMTERGGGEGTGAGMVGCTSPVVNSPSALGRSGAPAGALGGEIVGGGVFAIAVRTG